MRNKLRTPRVMGMTVSNDDLTHSYDGAQRIRVIQHVPMRVWGETPTCTPGRNMHSLPVSRCLAVVALSVLMGLVPCGSERWTGSRRLGSWVFNLVRPMMRVDGSDYMKSGCGGWGCCDR